MERIEINDLKSYINEDENHMPGLNLRPMYMIDDFDELINQQLLPKVVGTQFAGRTVRVAY